MLSGAVEQGQAAHPGRPALARFASQGQVDGRTQVRAYRQVLVDGLHPGLANLVGVEVIEPAIFEKHLARVRRDDARKHLDQRALPGTVVAEQAGDLTGPQLQADVGHCGDGPVRLREVLGTQHHRPRRSVAAQNVVASLRVSHGVHAGAGGCALPRRRLHPVECAAR